MADTCVDLDKLPHAQEEEEQKVDGDSGDCDDYSSGSDRSFEADDADSSGRGESGSAGNQTHHVTVRPRRKRRHGSHGSRRHKGGSRHKHKGFHPYPSSDEIKLKRTSQERQEKENAAAVVRREDSGQQIMTFPVAPFNSTQYLMDEHSANSPSGIHKTSSSSKLNSCSPQSVMLHSVASTPAEGTHEIIGFEKKDKEFVDIYKTVHAESLQSLPKEQLVKHYMNLEEKVAALQKKVAEAEQMRQDDDSNGKIKKSTAEEECVYDSVCTSDTNSLSSSNEEFVDLTVVNHRTCPTSESGTNSAAAASCISSGDLTSTNSAS